MRRLLWHRLSIPYKDFHEQINSFPAHALFFAQKDDVVLLYSTPSEHLLRFYSSIGLVPRQLLLVGVNAVGDLPAETADQVPGLRADFFMFTEVEEACVEKQGLILRQPLTRYEEYTSKLKFKNICRELDIQTPLYKNTLRARSIALKTDISQLFFRGYDQVVIKSDTSVAGYNTCVMSVSDFVGKLFQDVRPKQKISIQDERFFAEAWYDNVVAAPSIQFYVSENKVQQLSIHNQLFYKNKRTYRGCQSEDWLPDELVTRVSAEGKEIANTYQKRTYRGHLGLNAIVTSDKQLLWLEANPRRVMSSYAFAISKRIAPGQPYVSYRVIKGNWSNLSIEELFDRLRPVLFDTKSKQGVVPYDPLLKGNGSVQLFFTAPSKEQILELIEHVNCL